MRGGLTGLTARVKGTSSIPVFDSIVFIPHFRVQGDADKPLPALQERPRRSKRCALALECKSAHGGPWSAHAGPFNRCRRREHVSGDRHVRDHLSRRPEQISGGEKLNFERPYALRITTAVEKGLPVSSFGGGAEQVSVMAGG